MLDTVITYVTLVALLMVKRVGFSLTIEKSQSPKPSVEARICLLVSSGSMMIEMMMITTLKTIF